MATKPVKTAAKKPKGKLSDVKPSKADSLLRLQTGDAVAPEAAAADAPAPEAAAKKPARKAPAKAAKKAAAPKKEDLPTTSANQVAMHGETRYTYVDERGLQSLAWLAPIIDAVHAKGRVRITSAIHGEGATTMHVVLPGHEPPYDAKPGIILHVDVDNALSFDHVVIGWMKPALFEETAYAILNAIQPDDVHPANAVGRRDDWYARAIDVSGGISA